MAKLSEIASGTEARIRASPNLGSYPHEECVRRPVRSILAPLFTTGLIVASCVPGQTADPTTTAPAAETTTVPDTSTVPGRTTVTELPVRGRAAELPQPRTEVAGAVWEGRIVVVGGLDEGAAVSERTDIYDPDTDTWTAGPDLPVALHHTAVAALGGRVYVVGGYSIGPDGWIPEGTVWSLGPDDESWQREPDLGTSRGALAVASTGDRLVAVGGVGPGGLLTSTEILEAGEQAWRPGPDLSEPREHLAAAAVGDHVFAIAGRTGGFDTNKSSVEVLGSAGWDEAPALNFSRGGIGATRVGDVPCVAGGEEQAGTIATIECLVDDSWQVVDELEVARHGLVVVALGGFLHVIGGGPEPGLTVSDVHEVIPVSVE